MKIHYFQRYHQKENADTSNAIFLLSRFYSYSPTKFFTWLKNLTSDSIEFELSFNLQSKCNGSIPDAVIKQPSFKVVIETKLYGQFDITQLEYHAKAFDGEDCKLLLTLDPKELNDEFVKEIENKIIAHNEGLIHRHLTFANLINDIRDLLDDRRDYEMLEILNDYEDYCNENKLIPDGWKYLKVKTAGDTINFNSCNNIYYDTVKHYYWGYEYLGLYNNKSVRFIGKIETIVTAIPKDDTLKEFDFNIEQNNLNLSDEDILKRIKLAIIDSQRYYADSLIKNRHRFFFVEKFYETDYRKISLRGLWGDRVFDLCEVLGVNELPDTQGIAENLKLKTWE